MKTKIYALCDENNQIRYIGKTHTPLNYRLSNHLCEARKNKKTHRCCWIRSLLTRGCKPKIMLIGEVVGNGSRAEIAWISYFKSENVKLTNLTGGGDGGNMWDGYQESRKELLKNRKLHKVIQLTDDTILTDAIEYNDGQYYENLPRQTVQQL